MKLVAAALALPEATVTSYYRVIRDAGVIAKGGRGRSAPHLSALDTSRLVITLMSAEALSEAPEITRLIGNTECQYLEGMDPDDDPEHPTTGTLESIRFEDALAQLIAFRAVSSQSVGSPVLGDLGSDALFVRVAATRLTAEIEIDGSTVEFQHGYDEYVVTDPNDWAGLSIRERLERRPVLEGMKVTREIDYLAIKKIASGLPAQKAEEIESA